MKILKYLLLGLLGLVAVVLLAAAILPKSYEVKLSETINAPHAKVYEYVKLFKSQDEYSEWMKPDPNVKITIEGTDGTVGSSFYWKGNDAVGEGKITNKTVTPDLIEQEMSFIKPMESQAFFNTSFKAIDSTATELTIKMFGTDPYPFNLLSHLFGTKIIEETEKKNLQNLKAILEKR
jgi:uncharacterized protein YndB with AHSA1/START domain